MPIPPVDRSPSWHTLSADLSTTGASGAVPVRPINAPNPVESMDRLGEGAIVKTPDKPSDTGAPNRDWTTPEEKKLVEALPPEPTPEPIYKQLLDFIQSMWRASGTAIEMAQEINKMTLQERMALQAKNDADLTYSDPTVKRTGGL